MKPLDHNHLFTASDIERYHAGVLSMQQRHALEKAALDDPFLADALEGYANTATPQADLIELEQRLTAKTTTRKRGVAIPLFQKPWVRIAAMVLVLAGAGWVVYRTSFVQKENLAISNEIKKESKIAVKDSGAKEVLTESSLPAPRGSTAQNKREVSPSIKTNTQPLLTVKKAAVSTKIAPVASSPSPVVNEIKDVVPPTAETANAQEQAKETIMAKVAPKPQAFNTFRGQIVDANGNPVPYATIAVPGKTIGTTTNTQGQFLLTTPDSVVTTTVAAIGFQPNQVHLSNPAQEQKVVLHEASSSLEEVVVTGYGLKRARSNARPSDAKTKAEVEELEPEGGWSSFNTYVTQNLQIPEEVISKQLKGEVELSFDVDKNGMPANIKIEKSLCTSCDQEAIRLLKEGPSWTKKKRKTGKVKINF